MRVLNCRGRRDQLTRRGTRSRRPFFLYIWFHEPHSPVAAPDNIVSQYGDLDSHSATYSGTIDNTDCAIARLVAKLEDMGELDNTIIVYSSDYGSYRGGRNSGLRGHRRIPI